MDKLGKFQKVDLRSIWDKEASHFTPWLAQSENLETLGEALGIELELEAQEQNVGPFKADLLFKNTAEKDSWVVIENQIEKTDHRHLGQLLTYAAGLQAKTVVWISANFTDEHRAALDWLNRMTDESIQFFGIEIELWKIGDSPAAPRFNIVSKPNDWEKTVHEAADTLTDAEGTRSQNLRIKYWTAFRTYLNEKGSPLRSQKPSRDHWYSFGIGTSKAHIAALLITRDDEIGVELSITSIDSKNVFQNLVSQKQVFEGVIGAPRDWREMPDRKASRVVVFTSARENPYNETTWPQQFAWLQNNLEKFDAAFRPFFANRKG